MLFMVSYKNAPSHSVIASLTRKYLASFNSCSGVACACLFSKAGNFVTKMHSAVSTTDFNKLCLP